MRTYEVLFIIAPNVEEADADKLIEQMKQTVADKGGTVTKVDKLGRKRLAYEIKKFREGNYVLFNIEGSGPEIHELERRLRVSDAVLRYLTVRIDKDLKRASKIKSRRQARAARKPQRPAGAAKPSIESLIPQIEEAEAEEEEGSYVE